jgi:hypothetical protein
VNEVEAIAATADGQLRWAMGQRLRTLVLTLLLLGCGGESVDGPVGFVNQTKHSTADLWAIWTTAQHDIAQKIDLNPVQTSEFNVMPRILHGDPRALNVMPHQLRVAAEPDVLSSLLFAETGTQRPNPTGLIACPQPCDVRFSTAYSRYRPPVTRYAASWEFNGDNFSIILEYEFQNQILFALGYNMSWR